jgi:ATP-dependent DNA helicase PIF1
MELDVGGNFQEALELLEKDNSNLFITGKAGVGKSTLLSHFRDHTDKRPIVLAPTGVAALNVQGETIHSFFHFKSHITVELAKKKGKDFQKSQLYQNIDLIIIDEISMVRADLLDCVDAFLKAAFKNKKPFGGLRMVFIGDLYQLSPVVTNEEGQFFNKVYDSPYFFSASSFKKETFKFVELDKVFRQKDETFIGILNGIRNNRLEDAQLATLNERFLPDLKDEDGYIYLTTTNKDAEKINEMQLARIEGDGFHFRADVDGEFDLKNSPTDMELKFKVGAQVMFLNNQKNGLWVNGTIGKIIDISDEMLSVKTEDGVFEVNRHRWELYKYQFDEKKGSLTQEEVGSFYQFPLRLAWAITIHKSQGKTFDKVIVDMGRGAFAFGQTYVALSRCRTLDGIVLKKKLKKEHVFCDLRIVDFLTNWQYEISENRMPLDSKLNLCKTAIAQKKILKIVYLKKNDERSVRTIQPFFVGELFYENKRFLGVEAFCLKRKEKRFFRLDRILEIDVDESSGAIQQLLFEKTPG